MQDNLNQAMEREESLMNEQLEARKAEIMKIKKQNLDDRLRMATGEMSAEQVTQLKDQYEKEFENLDSAIRGEKQQQMSKMRAAMLQRRIEKERKRKLAEQEKEEARRREAVHKMNAGMAKVFRDYIQKKQAEMASEQTLHKNMNKESLKKKLEKWNKGAIKERKHRGGEEGDAWHLTHQQTEENKAMTEQEKLLLLAKQNVVYDANELYYRILRVERMADKVKEFTSVKDMAKIMSDINAINAQLNSRAPSANSFGTRRQ